MRKHTFKDWFIATRPWSFPASAMPIIVSIAYLFSKNADINWYLAVWTLIGMVLFHVTGNLWSDYFDFKKKVDDTDTFGATSITSGQFEASEIRNFAIGMLVVSVLSGLGILYCTGLPILWIGLAGAVCMLLYPFLKYNALGDLAILTTFAFLPTIGTSYAITGAIDWSVLYIALPVGLITDGILHANNTRDIATDKRAGIVTMAMSMGKKSAAWLYAFEVTFPYLWIVVCAVMGIFKLHTILVLISLPMAIKCAKTMLKGYNDTNAIAMLDMQAAQLQMLFSFMLSFSLISDKLFNLLFSLM